MVLFIYILKILELIYSNKKGDDKNIVDGNKIVSARVEQETWYSFEGDGQSDRVVLVYNLATTQIKKVFKIENKIL